MIEATLNADLVSWKNSMGLKICASSCSYKCLINPLTGVAHFQTTRASIEWA